MVRRRPTFDVRRRINRERFERRYDGTPIVGAEMSERPSRPRSTHRNVRGAPTHATSAHAHHAYAAFPGNDEVLLWRLRSLLDHEWSHSRL
jgi:hypothetical protein